ncbi:MAG: 3-oxoacyl-ACP reductase FabG [Herpetosiphonaceae bacterium]|nr:3-oxoacyl-ACP reductase FabG [Herpetosiphonaceae bacterium]
MGIELSNRVAVITGGANGIGLATALRFAQAGAAVAVWDVVEQVGQAAVHDIVEVGGRAAFWQVNVGDQAAVMAATAATVHHFGRIDILINNAGITRDAQLIKVKDGDVVGKLSEPDWDAVIAVNLKGVFNCTQAVAPVMIRQGYGRIVSAASVVGLYGNFGQTNYVASKSGVIGMTKVWARELGKRGITVNAVAPGFIMTDMTRAMPEKVLQGMVEHTPVGRMGQASDVATAYLFLASEEADFINGAVLNVDGGLVIGT